MSQRVPSNIAASIRQRLFNLSKERGEGFNLVLDRFAAERLLYRLSVSEHAEKFVLKGALLFLLWSANLYRPTRDVDLLGFGGSSIGELESIFRDVCRGAVAEDGLEFDAGSVKGAVIREEQAYEGVRITLRVSLGTARIPMQIDIGFGDTITPAAEAAEFPLTLTESALPMPRLKAYPRETVIAEKLEAMVVLDMTNSRMKDFHDLTTLAQNFPFDGEVLARATRSTFIRRGTAIPAAAPTALTARFAGDATKTTQWKGFLRRSGIRHAEPDFAAVIDRLAAFLLPVLSAIRENADFQMHWPAKGPWQSARL